VFGISDGCVVRVFSEVRSV